MNLKIKITLENRRLLRLRRSHQARVWCPICGQESDVVSENEILQIIESNMEAENLHKIRADDGKILICLKSLLPN